MSPLVTGMSVVEGSHDPSPRASYAERWIWKMLSLIQASIRGASNFLSMPQKMRNLSKLMSNMMRNTQRVMTNANGKT